MKRNIFTLLFCAIATIILAQGLNRPRLANTDLIITELPNDNTEAYFLDPIFPNIYAGTDDIITQITEVPDGTDRLVAVYKSGVIKIFPNKEDPTLGEINIFLDISSDVCLNGESGLQSIAFDPDYEVNGIFYLVYNQSGSDCDSQRPYWLLERFIDSDPTNNFADVASSEILISIRWFVIHHGGLVTFGPDGYLYVSKGSFDYDAQDLTRLDGKVLRLDVHSAPDPGLPYAIPEDNPFADGGPDGTARPEIFAYGFRNPYKYYIDSQQDLFFLGDVGEESYEEMNIVLPGSNYGWPGWEGSDCFFTDTCNSIDNTLPIAGYAHSGGFDAVVAGATTYDPEIPGLYGAFLFAEIQGQIFSLRKNGQGEWQQERIISTAPSLIAGSGYDLDGNVYFTGGFGNQNGVYVVRESAGNSASDSFPRKLSDLPSLLSVGSGQGHNVEGVYPYKPSSTLWSDGALKERYFALPGLEQVTRTDNIGWEFPDQSIIVKNFLLPLYEQDVQGSLKRIETRLLYKNQGDWYGFSYEWNDEETDAFLLKDSKTRNFEITNESGEIEQFTWTYPSRTDCMTCHTVQENRVLGISTPELNSLFTYPATNESDNQLEAMDYVGLFSNPLTQNTAEMEAIPNYTDESIHLEDRVKAYFHTNCAMCHQPGGVTQANIDFRWITSVDEMDIIDVLATGHGFGASDPKIIDSNKPDQSIILQRMQSLDQYRMPPLGTSREDKQATEMIRQWIIQNITTSDASNWDDYY